MPTNCAFCASCHREAHSAYGEQLDRVNDMCQRGWFFLRETDSALCPSCRAVVVRNSICNCPRLDGEHSATCRETLQPLTPEGEKAL